MRNNSHSRGFDARRQNKYSIRRFTVGTASIIVGATLLFGLGNEAKAAESEAPSTQETGNTTGQSGETPAADEGSVEAPAADQAIEKTAGGTEDVAVAAPAEKPAPDVKAEQPVKAQETNADQPAAATEVKQDTPKVQDAPVIEKSQNVEAPQAEQAQATQVEQVQAPKGEETQAPVQEEQQKTPAKADTATDNSKPVQADAPTSSVQDSSAKPAADNSPVVEETGTTETSNKGTQATDNQPVPTEKGSTSLSTDQKPQTATAESGKATPLKQQLNNDSVITNDTTSGTQNQKLSAADQPAETGEVAATPVNGQAAPANGGQVDPAKVDVSDPAVYKAIQESSQQKDASTIQASAETAPATRQFAVRSLAVKPNSTKQVAQNNVSAPQTNTLALAKAFAAPAAAPQGPIVADALADGYINTSTDTTNAANTLTGKAYIADKGTPATSMNGLTAVPDGTDVYMQWIDTDGSVSPVYTAKVKTIDAGNNSSQVGPGAYGFDLRDGFKDEYGNTHKYTATAGQWYKLWINDYTADDGNTMTMLRQSGGFIPGSYVNSTTGNNIGQFPLAGINMQRTAIFMTEVPSSDYMTGDQSTWIHDTQGPVSNPAVSTNVQKTVSGRVWLETGKSGLDLANSATGPNGQIGTADNADKAAAGYTVVMSSLTDEGVTAYNQAVNSLPEEQRAAAAKGLLEAHPEYISATVYGETDADGYYTLRFPTDTFNYNNLYGFVKDPQGNLVNSYSGFISPQFRAPTSADNSWTPQTVPLHRPAQDSWYNVNFALVPTANIGLDVVQPTVNPGGQATVDLTGTTMSPLPTHIEWTDPSGNIVKTTPDFTTIEEGESLADLDIPTTAKDGDVYTAYLVSGGTRVAADSTQVIIQPDASTNQPTVTPITKDAGQATTSDDVVNAVTTDYVPNNPANEGKTPTVTVDNVNDLPDGNTPGTVYVPATVTYPDGTTDSVQVPVTTKPAAPVVNPVEPGEDVTGTGYPGGTVDVTLPDGTTQTATVGDDGTWSVTPETPLTNGEVVTATQTVGTDNEGNPNVSPSDSVTVEDTTAPVVNPIDDVTVPEDQPITPIPVVTDDETATVDVTGLPEGVTYNPETGQIEGTPTTPGEYPVTVTVTDQAGNQTSEDFTITVTDETAPTIQPIDDVTVPEDQPITPIPVVTDDKTATVDVTGLPEGVTYNPETGQIEGTPTTPGEYPVTVTVTDEAGNQSEEHFTITVEDTTAPVVNPIDDVTVPEDQPITPIPVVTDDKTATVDVTGLPEGVTYNPETGQIEGTPTTPGEYPVTVTVTDEAGNQSEEHFTITVTDETAPTIQPIDDVTVPEKQPITPIPVVTDDETATVDVTGLPEGVTYNPETGQIEGTPTTPGTYPVTVTVTDEAGNQSEEHFTITVTDEAPTIQPIDDVTVPEDQPITPIPVVTDDENATVDVTGLPEGVTYNPETGQIEGTPTTPGTYPVTVTVTDENGNQSEEHFTITVEDTTPPVVNPIDDVTVPEDQPITPIPVVTDDKTATVEVTGLPEGVTYNPETGQIEGTPTTPGTYPVTVTVTDEAGNQSEEHFTITVTDETAPDAPVINPVDEGDKTVSGTGEPNGTVTVTFPDGSTATGTVDGDGNWTVDVPEGTELNPGDKVTATEKDEAGNVSEEATVTVTGKDTVAPDKPVINPVDEGDKTVSGTGEPNGTVTVTFPDGSTATGTVDGDGNWTVDVPEGTTVKKGDKITATVTDEAGNVSEEATITVTGEEPNQGTDGDKGDTGNNGDNTTPGNNTTPGDNGETSEPGTNGSVDNNGNQGNTGNTGDNSEASAPGNQGTDNSTAADNASELPNTGVETNGNANNGQEAVPGMETSDNGQVVTENGVPAEAADNSEAPAEQAKGDKELPETGTNNTGSATLFGGLFAALGSILLFRKRRQEKKDN